MRLAYRDYWNTPTRGSMQGEALTRARERFTMPVMWYGYGWGAMLLMLLSMLLWVAVVGLLVWALVRWLAVGAGGTGAPGAGPTGPSAIEILRQRYARGEIDATTFEQMRQRLEGSSSPTSSSPTSR